MQQGEIIYCPKYKFKSGTESDKLLINLNNPRQGEPYLILLVTSQRWTRSNTSGCYSKEGYYAIPKNIDFFKEEMTWVLFDTLQEFTLAEELKESWNNNFITKGYLKEDTLRAIINCLKNYNQISNYQLSLLRI